MILVRVLQRRDAASIVVAVAAGLVLANYLGALSYTLSSALIGQNGGGPSGIEWRQAYLIPLMAMIVSFVGLEILANIVVVMRKLLVGKLAIATTSKK